MNWIPRITWMQEDEEIKILKAEKEALEKYAAQLVNINRGLNLAIGQAIEQIDTLKTEAVSLLSAIAFQHGGSLTIKQEFFAALSEQEGELSLTIERNKEDRNVTISLETVAEEQDGKEDSGCCVGSEQ